MKRIDNMTFNQAFEAVHKAGAERHEGMWLRANDAAVNEMRRFGITVTDNRLKAFTSTVVFKVLNTIKADGLRELQKREWEKYKVTSTARGVQGNYIRLVEEIGEVAKALRNNDTANLIEELADVQAWLFTLASITGIDLENAYMLKYGIAECFRCHKAPCVCPEESKRR